MPLSEEEILSLILSLRMRTPSVLQSFLRRSLV